MGVLLVPGKIWGRKILDSPLLAYLLYWAYFWFLDLIIHYVTIISKRIQCAKADKKDLFFSNMLIKGDPGVGHPGFRIISLSICASMSLTCSSDFSFTIISLSDYWQLRQRKELPNNNIILLLRNKLSYQINISEDLVAYITHV